MPSRNITIDELRRNYSGDLDAVLASQPQACQVEIPSLAPAPQAKEERRPRKAAYTKGVMNETEKRFAKLLDQQRWLEPVSVASFEGEELQLSEDCKYTPDFKILLRDWRTDYVDVKGGFTREDSIIKGKFAAFVYPQSRFYIAALKKGKWHVRQLGVLPLRTIKIDAKGA